MSAYLLSFRLRASDAIGLGIGVLLVLLYGSYTYHGLRYGTNDPSQFTVVLLGFVMLSTLVMLQIGQRADEREPGAVESFLRIPPDDGSFSFAHIRDFVRDLGAGGALVVAMAKTGPSIVQSYGPTIAAFYVGILFVSATALSGVALVRMLWPLRNARPPMITVIAVIGFFAIQATQSAALRLT